MSPSPVIEVLPEHLHGDHHALRAYLSLADLRVTIDLDSEEFRTERQKRLDLAMSFVGNDQERSESRLTVGLMTVETLRAQQEELDRQMARESNAALLDLLRRTKENVAQRQAELDDVLKRLRAEGSAPSSAAEEETVNIFDSSLDAIMPKSWTRNQKRLAGAVTLGALVLGGLLYIRGKIAKEAGKGSRAAGKGLLASAGIALLAFFGFKKFEEFGNIQSLVEAGKEKIGEWQKYGIEQSKYFAGLALYRMGNEEEARRMWGHKADQIIADLEQNREQQPEPATRVDENGIEFVRAEDALWLYTDALNDALHPFRQFVRTNREGILVIAATTVTLSPDVRRALLNTAGMSKDTVLTLLRFFGGTVKRHPILSILSVMAALYVAKKGSQAWVPKDPENLQKFFTNQLEIAGEKMEGIEVAMVSQEDWEMLAGILQGANDARIQLAERTRELFDQMAQSALERTALAPEELIETKNGTGLSVFVGFLEAMAIEHPELEEDLVHVQEYVGALSHPLTPESIQRIQTLTTSFDVLIEEEGGVYVYRIRDEQGMWHTRTLCLNPAMSVEEQAAYARTFIIDRDDWTEAINQAALPMQQAREWADYIFFSDVESEEDAAAKLEQELNSGGTIVVRSGIAYLCSAGEGVAKKYVIGPYEFTVKPFLSYFTGDFSAVELVMDYSEGLLPVFALGTASAISRLGFAEIFNGKVLVRTLNYPISGTVGTGKLIGKSVIAPLWNNIKNGHPWHRGILQDPKNILIAGARERIYRFTGLVQRGLPSGRLTTIGLINRQIAFLEEAKKLITLSRYKLVDSFCLNEAQSAIMRAYQGVNGFTAPSVRHLAASGDLSELDALIKHLQSEKAAFRGAGSAIPSGAGGAARAAAEAAEGVGDATRIVGHIEGKPVYLAKLVDAAAGNDDAMRAINAGLSHGDEVFLAKIVNESGSPARAVSRLAGIGKALKVVGNVSLIGLDAFVIVSAAYDSQQSALLAEATSEGELKDLYEGRQFFHRADMVAGGVGLVAGSVALFAAGTTAAAVAWPVALATAPVSLAFAALYERHKFHEDLARGVEDWKREYDPHETLANLRTLGFGEALGREANIMLQDGNVVAYGLTTGMPLLDTALNQIKNRIIYWKTQETRARQQEEIDAMHRDMIQAILEESNLIQVPLTVRDPDGSERALTENEMQFYGGCNQAYQEAKAQYLRENGQDILFHGGGQQERLGFLLRSAEMYGRLQHDRFAYEHRSLIILDASKMPEVALSFPDESLSIEEQAREYQVMQDGQILARMLADAMVAIANGNENAAHPLIKGRVVPILEQRAAPHMLAFRTKIQETNFSGWGDFYRLWTDGNQAKLTELNMMYFMQDVLDREAEKMVNSVISTARSADRVSGEDMLNGLWNNLASADAMINSYLQNPKARWQELKGDHDRLELVQEYFRRLVELEEARNNVETLRQKVAGHDGERVQTGRSRQMQLQRQKSEKGQLQRYERVLREHPKWLAENPL